MKEVKRKNGIISNKADVLCNKYCTQILENINDLIWVIDASTGKYKFMIGATRKISGYEPEDYLQMTMEDSIPPHSYKIAMDITKAEVDRFLKGDSKDNPEITFDLEIYRKDKSLIWVAISSRIIMNEGNIEILGVSRLIEDRKRLELELKHSQEWYSLIANNANNMTFIIDVDTLRTVYVGGNSLDIVGFTNEEYIGVALQDVMPPDDYFYITNLITENLRKHYRGVPNATEEHIEYYHYHKDGSLMPMESSAKIIFNDDNTPKYIITITRRRFTLL